MGYVYLIHFEKPYKHARHYLGYVDKDVDERLDQHYNGKGSTLTKVVFKAGIKMKLARFWENVDRNFERRLKNGGGSTRYRPICKNIKKGL